MTTPADDRRAITVGGTQLLALSDGVFTMPPGFLGAAAHTALGEPATLAMPIGCFLFPAERLLIDLGFGPAVNSLLAGGSLPAQLSRAGCEPADIDTIALTHLHPDHIGWLATPDGQQRFRQARLLIATADWEYFIGQGQGEMEGYIRAALAEAFTGGRVELISGEHAISRHVTALPAPGHTPGHTVFAVHDHGERALLLGDAVYCPQQLGHSDWAAVSDVDPKLAARTREALERDLESDGALAVGAHFPGLQEARILTSQ